MRFASCTDDRTGACVHVRLGSRWVPIPEQPVVPTCSAALRVTSPDAGIGAADDPQPVPDRRYGVRSPAAPVVRSIGGHPEMIAKRPRQSIARAGQPVEVTQVLIQLGGTSPSGEVVAQKCIVRALHLRLPLPQRLQPGRDILQW